MDDDLSDLRNHKYFRRLINLIEEHPYKEDLAFWHSSLIVKGGSILSVGINKPNPNSFALNYAQHKGWQTHSEAEALYSIRYSSKITGSVMYNCRISRNKTLELSKPCKGCHLMLKDFGFKKVYFSRPDGYGSIKV